MKLYVLFIWKLSIKLNKNTLNYKQEILTIIIIFKLKTLLNKKLKIKIELYLNVAKYI